MAQRDLTAAAVKGTPDMAQGGGGGRGAMGGKQKPMAGAAAKVRRQLAGDRSEVHVVKNLDKRRARRKFGRDFQAAVAAFRRPL